MDYSCISAIVVISQKDDFARIKRVYEFHLIDLCSFSQIGSEKMSSVVEYKSNPIVIIIHVDAQDISSPSSLRTFDDIESFIFIDIQIIAQISSIFTSIINILSFIPIFNHFLSIIIDYCRIDRNEISDLLKSGKKFIDENNGEERVYEREE